MSGTKEDGTPESSAGDEKFYVEKLVGKRILKSGKVEYQVKWWGWSSKSNTFESREVLMEDCPNLVRDFENSRKRKRVGEQSDHAQRSAAVALEDAEDEGQRQADSSEAMDDDDGNDEMVQDPGNENSGSGDGIEILENNQTPKRQAPLEPEMTKMKKTTTNGETSISTVPVLLVPPTQENKSRKSPQVSKPKLIPERILGITQDPVTNELQFLIKWKDMGEANLVPATRAHIGCPQLVIKYYEHRLIWRRDSLSQAEWDDELQENGRDPEDEFFSDFDWEIII